VLIQVFNSQLIPSLLPVVETSWSTDDHPEGTYLSHGERPTQQPPVRAHFLFPVCS